MDVSGFSRWSPLRRHDLRGLPTVGVRVDAGVDAGANATPVTAAKSKPKPTSKPETWETTIEKVGSWPEEARPLKAHTWLKWLYALGDILLALLPLYFIRKLPSFILYC